MDKRIFVGVVVLLTMSMLIFSSSQVSGTPQQERTYDYEIDTHGYIFESSISAHNIGEARSKLLDIFLDSFGWELENSEITFIGDRPHNGN